MPLKSRLLLLIQNDNTVYQLLLTSLLITSPALHYLCFYKSFDPFWLRVVNSTVCFLALTVSFYTGGILNTLVRYLAITSFIIVNNGILLGLNGFQHIYFFSAVVAFMVLTLFCRNKWDFVILCTLNISVILIAYTASSAPHIPPLTLAVLLAAFTFIAYMWFVVRVAYSNKFKKAICNINELNNSLMINHDKLRDSGKKFDALINSLNDIIFEFDENKICLNTWFKRVDGRPIDPELCIGKNLAEVLGAEKAKKFDDAIDYVIKHREAISITYPSDFGTGRWFVAKMAPVYDREGNYNARVSASVSDISEQKKYADALKENETLLLEAQSIAKIGNWYYDIETQETFLSENLLSILEIDFIPEGIEKFTYYLSLVHPDDRSEANTYLTNIHEADKNEFEHKLVTPKGSLKYIKILKGELLKDNEGGLKRITGILQDITDIKLSEKIIKVSQAELLEAQLIAKIGNWKWDIALNKLSWSDEINNIFEIKSGTVVESNIIRMLIKYAHPNDRHILKQHLKDISNITNTSYEYRIVTANDKVKYLSIIVGKLLYREDGTVRKAIGTIQDITERKQAEIDYQRTENQYKLVLETIKMPAISVDKKGDLIFCNKFMAHILGYDQNEILGLNWLEKFLPEDQRNGIAKWFINGSFEAQYISSVICHSGEIRNISWQNTVSYDENGNIKEVTSIGEDITLRQKATQALISAKEEAEKSSHFKSEFLSIMSHEIRTPMNAVIGTTNLLLSENPLPEQLEYLNTLKFSGENLLAIINDILDYNKIEAGKLTLNLLPFNIFILAQKIKQSFYARAAEKYLEIDLIIDNLIPEYLIGDQIRLGQVLNNLISNAVKFTHKGKVGLQLQKENITPDQITIKFIVTDTGIGISPSNLESIFDPFMQESQIHENDYGGTGLGLAITKRLVDLHQGNIEVISELGKGTEFSFSITFELANQVKKSTNIDVAVTANIERSLTGMRILVVDDNKMNLMIASKFLKKWHVNVDEAISGELAIEMATNTPYDLIIMDLQMPVLDGFETTRIIRKNNPNIPVIALTADAMPETYNKALAAGMCNYLTKPFVPDTLYEKISGYYVAAVKLAN